MLLIPLIVFWKYRNKRKYQPTFRVSSTGAYKNKSSIRVKIAWLPDVLRYLAISLFVISLARPQQTLKEEEINAEGIDIMITMDVSPSMEEKDFDPNRMEVSKALAQDFILKRSYDRLGLVVFAEDAYTQSPLTTDHNILVNLVSQLYAGMLGKSTAIGMGLATAVNRLKNSESKSKIIVLLTDGDNNSGFVDPEQAITIAEEFDVKVYTIGIGSNRQQQRGLFSFGGGNQLNEPLLKKIAQETGGRYYRATTREALQRIYETIDQLEKTKIEVKTLTRYVEEFRIFLFIGLGLLLLELLLRFTILKRVP